MDAQRAANVLGIPYYVWDFSERFKRRRRRRLHRRVLRRPHPEPVHALQRADQVRRPAREGARARLRRRLHRPLRRDRARMPTATASCTAPPTWAKDQSYVLGVLTAEQLAHAMFPLGATPSKAEVRAEAAARGLTVGAEARQPRHLLHPRRRHPRLAGRAGRPQPGESSTGRRRRRRRTRARTPTPSASGTGLPSACRRPTGSRASCSRCGPRTTRSSSARGRRSTRPRSRPPCATLVRPGAGRPATSGRGRSGRTARSCPAPCWRLARTASACGWARPVRGGGEGSDDGALLPAPGSSGRRP